MKARIPVGVVMMLAVLALSLVPAATLTARPADALSTCDRAQFIADVTVPDGTRFSAGSVFTKTWRLKNIGTCTWTTSYALIFSSGDRMGGASPVSFPVNVAPGHTVDLSVSLAAPATGGHYIGYWKFQNASGAEFGIGSLASKPWWVEINVTGAPSVAYDFAANYCSATWSSMQGDLPCAGTDGDARGYVLKVGQPQLEDGTVDPGVALLTAPQDTYNGDIHGAYPAFAVQAGDHFQSVVNCARGATNCDVTFRLDYRMGTGPVYTLWSFHEKYDGMYSRTDIDLSPLAGHDVQFILTVLATGFATGDRALWVNPVIVRKGGSTPPLPGARNFDFGTSTSPVAPGYVQVTEATSYTAGAYGWTAPSHAESRDSSTLSDALRQDFVMSGTSAPTFRVDLPNGNYAVTVIMGDPDAAHDNMIVKANGRVMLADVDTAPMSFAVNTFIVTASSGTLTLQFLDAGGVNSVWVVNAVSIVPTSQPPTACDRAQFIADVTVPDGTTFAPAAAFLKTWRLKNVGTCPWTTDYALVFDSGNLMDGLDVVKLSQNVPPGSMVDVSVHLTAPSTAGSYRGYWRFQNADGIRFGIGSAGTKSWWVDIRVIGTIPSRTPTPTATVTPTGTLPSVTPVPGLTLRGYVRLQDGSGLSGVKICRSFASYSGVIVATTDASGYYQSDFTYIPGDEMVTVWPSAPGYSFVPDKGYWRHYYGVEDHTANFVASPISSAEAATPPTPCPTGTPVPPSSTPTPTATVTETPTATATPSSTPTATATNPSTTIPGWSWYVNNKYLFAFQFPPQSILTSAWDNGGHIDLPLVTAGTNLHAKYLDISVTDNASVCQSPETTQSMPTSEPQNVTINGIQFLKQTGEGAAMMKRYDWTGYSTMKGNACISLTFTLRSIVQGAADPTPPAYDPVAESAVIDAIMSTYANR